MLYGKEGCIPQRWLKVVSVSLIFLMLGACASAPRNASEENDQLSEAQQADKFEGFNRAVFKFNDTVDRWLLKPVAKGYGFAVPKPVKLGVGNFFGNLGEIRNIINDGLQWKWKQAANDTGRFVMNSTLGLLGLFDVASHAGLEKSDGENFSQTLAKWGVPRGSYIVLPFMGPNTVRGGVSMPVDWYSSPMQYVESPKARIGANALDIVHSRYGLLEAEELISGDRYSFIREVYLQRLDYLENDGVVEDDFGGDFEDEEYDDEEDF